MSVYYDIHDIINLRQITQVLHFTTTEGLLGIIATWSVKSRSLLPKEKYLEFVYKPNAIYRKDDAWFDYVNLSIQRVNSVFFDICANKWHKGKEWCVLAFQPQVMTHDGVYFATTNNMYSDVTRKEGIEGLELIFAPRVRSAGKMLVRDANKPQNEPTCSQAEILYPNELSLNFLQKIYLSTEEQSDNLVAHLAIFKRPNVEYVVDISIFS